MLAAYDDMKQSIGKNLFMSQMDYVIGVLAKKISSIVHTSP